MAIGGKLTPEKTVEAPIQDTGRVISTSQENAKI
jgi:hypothetical protein